MVCDYCGQKHATVHIKRVVNGRLEEQHACEMCASKYGLNLAVGKSFDIDNVFGGLFGDAFGHASKNPSCCPVCAKTFREIVDSGRVGCAQCYLTFYDQLQPTIRRIHGSAVHVGKIADSGSVSSKKAKEIEDLKASLQTAVREQDFELCAALRDQIKAMEASADE